MSLTSLPVLTCIYHQPSLVKVRIGRLTYTYQASEFQIRQLEANIKHGWRVFNRFKKQSTLIKRELI